MAITTNYLLFSSLITNVYKNLSISADKLKNDLYLNVCRSKNLYKNFGSYLKFDKPVSWSYLKYTQALQDLILAFLNGGTVHGMKHAIKAITGVTPLYYADYPNAGTLPPLPNTLPKIITHRNTIKWKIYDTAKYDHLGYDRFPTRTHFFIRDSLKRIPDKAKPQVVLQDGYAKYNMIEIILYNESLFTVNEEIINRAVTSHGERFNNKHIELIVSVTDVFGTPLTGFSINATNDGIVWSLPLPMATSYTVTYKYRMRNEIEHFSELIKPAYVRVKYTYLTR